MGNVEAPLFGIRYRFLARNIFHSKFGFHREINNTTLLGTILKMIIGELYA